MRNASFIYYKNNEDGASAVEFALLLPILILLFIGCVDVGYYLMNKMRLQNLSYSVAEYVAQADDDTNVQDIAAEMYEGDYENIELTSQFFCECSDGVAAECPIDCGADDYQRRFVTITADATFSALLPYPGIPNTLDMQSITRMRVD